MNYSDSKFYKRNGDLFIDLNSDIDRIVNALNDYTEKDNEGQIFYPIKRLLVNIESNALYKVDEDGFNFWDKYSWRYGQQIAIPLSEDNNKEDIVDDEAREIEAKTQLQDSLICRTPMIPSRDNSREMGSYITVNLLENDLSLGKNNSYTTIAIDTWTPPSQWVIDDGLRPYVLCSYINKVMTKTFRQNDGVKYRLTQVINAKLSDDLLGFRLVYEAIIEN